jgi:hypothetical protein
MLQAGAVTYAKFQNVNNARFLANYSGVAAPVSEYTFGAGFAMNGTVLNNTATPPPGLFKNLAIKVATNTTVAVAADAVAMTDGAGNYRTAAIAATCDLGTNGAANRLDTGTIAIDTWYYIWAISNGVTDGTLASTSATAPTMPAGYTFKARIGAVRTIHASATLYGTWQLGRRAQYVVGLAQTTAPPLIVVGTGGVGTYSPTAPIWSSQTVQGNSGQSAHVPSTASAIEMTAVTGSFKGGTGTGSMQVAPNASYGGYQSAVGSVPTFDNGGAINNFVAPFKVILEAATIQVAMTSSTGLALLCNGWEDNI